VSESTQIMFSAKNMLEARFWMAFMLLSNMNAIQTGQAFDE